MRARVAIQIVTLALATALPSFAQLQEQVPERWQLKGILGLDLSKSTDTQLFVPSSPTNTSEYSTIAGDLSLLLGGYLKDPKFLPFTINFSGEHGSNRVSLGGFRNNIYDFGGSASFLPERPFPFHIFYQRSQYGAIGAPFGENSDTSTFGFDWAVRVHRLPHLDIRYLKEANELRLITSLTGSSYRLNELGIGASDTWKDWRWNAGFTDFSSTNSAAQALALPSPYQESLKAQSLFVSRTFWDDTAHFNFADRAEWEQSQFLGKPTGQFTDAYATSQLQINHTPKLSSNYFYTFSHASSSGESSLAATEATSSSVSLIPIPAVTTQTFGGGVQYRVLPCVTLFQQDQEYLVTAVPGVTESETSLTDSAGGAGFGKVWRGVDLGARYTGDFQIAGTTLEHHPTKFSNNVEARAGWGDPRRLRLVASGVDTKYNLIAELGGFTSTRSARLQAETTRLFGWHLGGSVERARLEYLSASGDIKSNTTNYVAHVIQRRLALSGGHEVLTGAGALFPALVTAQQWISVPLPLSELVATPLLNRLAHVDTATAALHLRRTLDVTADYLSEKDVLTTSQIRFRTVDVGARYHVGKLGVQAGFASYRIENATAALRTGTLMNRYYLRVTRDFKVF